VRKSHGMRFTDATDDRYSGEVQLTALPFGIGMFLGLSRDGQPLVSSHALLTHAEAWRLVAYLQRALRSDPCVGRVIQAPDAVDHRPHSMRHAIEPNECAKGRPASSLTSGDPAAPGEPGPPAPPPKA